MMNQRTGFARVSAVTLAIVAGLSLAGCANGDNAPGETLEDGMSLPTPDSGASAEQNGSTAPKGESTADGLSEGESTEDIVTRGPAVPWEDALETARAKFSGELTEMSLDRDDGRYEYHFELFSDSHEFDIEIDAKTGSVIDEEIDELDSDDLAELERKRIDLGIVIPLEEAADIARRVHAGVIVEWKLEGGSDGPTYEFDVTASDGGEHDVEIHALTGDVLDR